MLEIGAPRELRGYLDRERASGKTVGLVPTMGALHRGHFALISRARTECDVVCVSIFVNPLQFNNPVDFERYPRNIDADLKALEGAAVDVVFRPTLEQMHPSPSRIRFSVTGISDNLEGEFRPGHFDGVATVVAKLFLAAGPGAAYFGEKDFQQTRVVAEMVREFHFPNELVIVPTVREPDGLALSSRNQLLSGPARKAASGIFRAIVAGKSSALAKKSPQEVTEMMRGIISGRAAEFGVEAKIDYLEVVSPRDLRPSESFEATSRFFVAASYDGVRLIDNAAVFE